MKYRRGDVVRYVNESGTLFDTLAVVSGESSEEPKKSYAVKVLFPGPRLHESCADWKRGPWMREVNIELMGHIELPE